jgi:hypothetical protein
LNDASAERGGRRRGPGQAENRAGGRPLGGVSVRLQLVAVGVGFELQLGWVPSVRPARARPFRGIPFPCPASNYSPHVSAPPDGFADASCSAFR